MAVVLQRDPATGELSYASGSDSGQGQATEAPLSGGQFFVDPSGAPRVVPTAEAQAAESRGYRPSSAQESGAIQHENYLQRTYGDSELESFGEGVLRGGSFGVSDLILQGLGVSKERLSQVQGRSPYAALGGELAGAIGTAFIPGSPAAMLGKAATGLEEAVAGARTVQALAKGGKVAQAVARYAPTLIRSATEGAVYGAGGGFSKAVLSDDPMTAESLVGDIASGALTGAATGVVLGTGFKFLGDSARAATRYIRSTTTPTIADAVISHGLPEAAAKGEIPTAIGEVAGEIHPVSSKPTKPVPDEVIEDFKAKYHQQDTVSRQQIRQMEGLIAKGKEVAPEIQDAAVELEKARRAMRRFLPLEQERSYGNSDPLLGGEGELGGSYAKGQGKSMQTWLADNKTIAEAVRKPGFRDALIDNQEAIDKMQGLLGNKEYPPIVGEHGIFTERKPGMDQLRNIVESKPVHTTPKAGPSKKVDTSKLEEMFGIEMPKETPLQTASKAGRLVDAAKPVGEKFIKHVTKKYAGMAVGAVLGHGMGHGMIGAILGHEVIGGITTKLASMVGKGMAKLADGVDAFLANPKAVAAARKTTQGILGGTSFAMGNKGEEHKGSTFEKRSSEIEQAIGNPQATRHVIHESLAGVRAADPLLADQMEELAFNRLLFIGDKMPKNPGVGVSIGKRSPWHPTDADVSRWARVIATAENPSSVVEDMADGTVTKEQADTLEVLYPETYRRLQNDLVRQAGELQTDMSWQQRLTISTLFHVPVDSVLRGSMTTTLQATWEEKPPETGGGGGLGKMPSIKGPQGTPAQKMAG